MDPSDQQIIAAIRGLSVRRFHGISKEHEDAAWSASGTFGGRSFITTGRDELAVAARLLAMIRESVDPEELRRVCGAARKDAPLL